MKKNNESYMKNRLIEILGNPETLWKTEVGTVEDNDIDEIEVDETLRQLERVGIVANVKRNEVSEELVTYTFNCLDPDGFEEVTEIPLIEYATPVDGLATEEIDWSNVSTKMSDYRKI